METVTLKAIFHNEMECIGIFSRQNATLNYYFQKKAGAKWSKTNKCWYVTCTEKNYELLCKALTGKAIVDVKELKQYLLEKKKDNTFHPLPEQPATVLLAAKINTAIPAKQLNAITAVSQENSEALQKFRQQLILKSYSPSTIKTYTNEFAQFLQTIGKLPANEFSTARIKDYLQYCFEKLKLSENTLHSRMNALKFYYEQVLKKEKFFWEIPRPKKPLILPKLLNETELRKLFNALTNKKHKAMLFTAYSAGLRVSEIVNLKIADIDSKRMQIFISRAKGKKDRYVNLSPLVLDILRKYLKEYTPVPKLYLFESEQTFTAYPTRTVQQIFSTAKRKAGISKEVGIHCLRHSFATHLLDKGTDIKYIKDLLGHFNIKTTERYLHVSNKQLVNIVSPFDDLFKDGNIDW
ncbi:MAG: tyrosine-type recombinase/integrase [Bacteroidota bacterium]|nr:tyrosine-type recombinase/integrase [Bacteroidota bacterium]